MNLFLVRPSAIFTVLVLLWSTAGVEADDGGSSSVCRVSLTRFVDGAYDLDLVLYYQSGRFHHGYAVVPKRDNLVHRIEVKPARPVAWQDAEGNPVEIPANMRGNYSYTDEGFGEYRRRYEDGEIRIVHPIAVPELAWDGAKLTGTVDVQVTYVDSSLGGRSPLGRTFRVVLNLGGRPLQGEAVAWEYDMDRMDDSFGADAPRQTFKANARWDEQPWQPKPGTQLAPGKSWPQSTGPLFTEAAEDHDGPLVRNLHDARLVWVAEDAMPGSSGTTRGNFAMRTFAWTGYGNDVFGSPAVADGRVFVFTSQPGVEHLAHHPVVDENNAFYRLGIKSASFGSPTDVITAYDAQTGRRLWRHVGIPGDRAARGKSTNGLTHLVAGDRVIVRGAGALYALDAATGRVLWQKTRVDRLDLTLNNTHQSSVDASPSLIDGTVVMPVGRDGDLVGLDPADGSLRWRAQRVIGYNQVPSRVVIGNQTWILAVGGSAGRNEPFTSSLIHPDTGEIKWTSTETGENVGNVIVYGDMLFANCRSGRSDDQRWAGFRVSEAGLERIWENEQAHRMGGRQIPVGHRGVLYADSRRTGFRALDMRNGEALGRNPLIPDLTHGSHNWSWATGANDRILTAGILMFSTAQDGFRLLPGRLSLDLKGGYVCPSKPALVDGRLFVRLGRKLVCYDLRADPEMAVESARFVAKGIMADGRDWEFRLRSVQDGRRNLAVRFPPRHGAEAYQVNNWVAHVRRTLDWKSTPVSRLDWENDRFAGDILLTVGWHHERWTLDLHRADGRLSGSVTRSASPLEQPLNVEGTIGGKYTAAPDRPRRIELELREAARRFDSDSPLRSLWVVLTAQGDQIRHAWAFSGAINGNNHEVDFSDLRLQGQQLTGSLTVLMHDDMFVDIHPEGGLLAARYEVDARLNPEGPTGTHRGALGVRWSRKVPVEGTVAPETWSEILDIASGVAPTVDTQAGLSAN